jgi:hypothetical protein
MCMESLEVDIGLIVPNASGGAHVMQSIEGQLGRAGTLWGSDRNNDKSHASCSALEGLLSCTFIPTDEWHL